jgi:hypothetical protein
VFWDTDILDLDDRNKRDTIIGDEELFKVRFRVELQGRLWKCITGDWLFDVGFTKIGREKSFYLSDLLPGDANFQYRGWRGCDTLCIERVSACRQERSRSTRTRRSTRRQLRSNCAAAMGISQSSATRHWRSTSSSRAHEARHQSLRGPGTCSRGPLP